MDVYINQKEEEALNLAVAALSDQSLLLSCNEEEACQAKAQEYDNAGETLDGLLRKMSQAKAAQKKTARKKKENERL